MNSATTWTKKSEAKAVAKRYAEEYAWYCYTVVAFNNNTYKIVVTDAENVISWLNLEAA